MPAEQGTVTVSIGSGGTGGWIGEDPPVPRGSLCSTQPAVHRQ